MHRLFHSRQIYTHKQSSIESTLEFGDERIHKCSEIKIINLNTSINFIIQTKKRKISRDTTLVIIQILSSAALWYSNEVWKSKKKSFKK